MATMQKRVFRRTNADGTTNEVVCTWEKEKPTETFQLESSGYSGHTCVSELGNVEKLLGSANIEAKPEMYAGEDPQNVFIVGMQ